ncbi:MAG TPA: hypothetical protein VEC16_02920 [Alphaproteobacteria bacterium]|nr:hypothetical protein [Alphaproteobacteria bacterium]
MSIIPPILKTDDYIKVNNGDSTKDIHWIEFYFKIEGLIKGSMESLKILDPGYTLGKKYDDPVKQSKISELEDIVSHRGDSEKKLEDLFPKYFLNEINKSSAAYGIVLDVQTSYMLEYGKRYSKA